jgi:hypothetical protein
MPVIRVNKGLKNKLWPVSFKRVPAGTDDAKPWRLFGSLLGRCHAREENNGGMRFIRRRARS